MSSSQNLDPSSIDSPIYQEFLQEQQLQEVELEEQNQQDTVAEDQDKEKRVEDDQKVKIESSPDTSRRNIRGVQTKV